MLRQLAIRNVVLIDQLEIEFEPGLGVLTGETGGCSAGGCTSGCWAGC